MIQAEPRTVEDRLAGGLTLVLGLIALIQLGSWLPHYLTWPYWADHDVFGNVARAWDRGEAPYLDVRLNNFPGTVYVLYVLGKLAGWGRPWTFYAFDAVLLVGLVTFLPVWSRRTSGWFLPGFIGSLAFLHYYLSLDYCMTAQRDWQSPACSVLGLLAIQAWPNRLGRFASAWLAAFALSIRPQSILLLPALGYAVLASVESGERRAKWLRGSAWLAVFGVFSALWFLPLVVAGVFDDFARSLQHVAYGSRYNRVSLVSFATLWFFDSGLSRWSLVSIALVWFIRWSDRGDRKIALAWLIALAGASFYKPLSPMPHPYLDIPLTLVGSVVLAVVAGLILSARQFTPKFRWFGIFCLLIIGENWSWPTACRVDRSFRAFATLGSGVEPEERPIGYRRGTVRSSAFYRWSDYRAMLLYLRERTGPETRVANALKAVPAIVSEVDRPSAFPAESTAWLSMVNPDDEDAFARSLERWNNSVVIWSPGEVGPVSGIHFDHLEAAIRRLYRFEARFGAIEVWRRIAEPERP